MTITAKLIAYSQAPNKQTVATFEIDYPRYVHGELMTHRMFSRNAMSSRAVPVEKMIEQVRSAPATPIHWGKNQSGMQAKEELARDELVDAKGYWYDAAVCAAEYAEAMHRDCALHKQVVNRILEPFQTMKTVVTSTEWDNFFYLRNHEDAQPEIKRLAEVMLACFENESPVQLTSEDWHVPYYQEGFWKPEFIGQFGMCDVHGVTLEDALAISSSCCAQVSFRQLDDTLEKAKRIYERLVESKPVHASPFEHQCKPMKVSKWPEYIDPSVWIDDEEDGVTHADRKGNYWSGNFKGFIQHRQLIPGNVYVKESV